SCILNYHCYTLILYYHITVLVTPPRYSVIHSPLALTTCSFCLFQSAILQPLPHRLKVTLFPSLLPVLHPFSKVFPYFGLSQPPYLIPSHKLLFPVFDTFLQVYFANQYPVLLHTLFTPNDINFCYFCYI